MKQLLVRTVKITILSLAVFCIHPSTVEQGGGGSEVEVVGCVYLPGNDPAPATQVKLIPQEYDPSVMAAIGDSMIDTSDAQGRYSFRNVAPGMYNVQAIQLKQGTRMLVTGLEVDSGTITVPAEPLQEPGIIRLLLPGSAEHNGYAMIPGTDISVFVAVGSNEIVLDSVPAGRIPEVRYKVLDDTAVISSRNVDVKPAETTMLVDPSWRSMRSICLNTSSSGAGVESDVYGFPILIRLSGDNFDFSQAQTGGGDLLFVDRNGMIPPYEIERWDPSAGSAEIWVKVDTVFGDDSTQSITMYWGNPAASTRVSDTAVFDTAAGFQGVWHLGEGGNNAALDATANRFDGTAYHMSGDSTVPGAIGNARAFDGDSGYITMPNTASGKLNFPEDGYFSISAWVYAETFDNVYRTIATKGFEQYFLQLSYFPGPEALWQFSVFQESATWNMSHNSAKENQWVLLTGVRQGTSQFLYCNGELIAKSGIPYAHPDTIISRDTTNDFTMGRFMREATYPMKFGYCFFKGMIDEVRICSTARTADWIKLCYMNQRSDDRFVKFK